MAKIDNKTDMKNKFEDWMVRVSFAEANQPELAPTNPADQWRAKVAFDKIMVVRSEKTGEASPESRDMSAEKTPPATAVRSDDKLRVMVLDDEPIVGKRLKSALTKYGFEVEIFENPDLALERLQAQAFDIVVTDLRMEEIDGIQVLEYIMEHCKDTRVILITGYATVEVAREALVKGAFDFIAKPFKPNDLRAVINKAALSLGHVAG